MPSLKKLLVPTDFSENAASIYQFVRHTAEKYGSRVDFIHIMVQPAYARFTKGKKAKEEDEQLKKELIKDLEEKMEREIEEPNRGKVFVYEAEQPSNAIVKHAKKEGYDLIMIASRGHGKSVFTRGSVTEKLIRLSSTPVLSANKGYNPEIKTIVVPTDGSQLSMEALPLALALAIRNKAEVHLLGVHIFESVRVRALGGDQITKPEKERKETILTALKKFVDNAENQVHFTEEPSIETEALKMGVDDGKESAEVYLKLDQGFSAQEAISHYATRHAELVVMATHGRGALAQLFIGSTTEKVARHLRLPVITIKPSSVEKES